MEFIKKHKNALTLFIVPQIILLFLRLCEIVNWSWFIVLIPIELFAGIILLSAIAGVILGIAVRVKHKDEIVKKVMEDYNRENTSSENS